VGAFLVPLRLFGVSSPVSVLFAMANAPLVSAGRRVTRAGWGGAVPALLWLGLALRLGTPSSGGDIVIAATPTGYAFLLVGTVAAAVGLCVPHRPVGKRCDGGVGRRRASLPTFEQDRLRLCLASLGFAARAGATIGGQLHILIVDGGCAADRPRRLRS